MDLPAFLLSKNFYSESIGMPQLPRDVSGGTYPSALRGLAFQLCFALLGSFGFSEGSRHSSLATRHFRKIKNPASSAGYSHSRLSGSTRSSTSFYPVLVKNLT